MNRRRRCLTATLKACATFTGCRCWASRRPHPRRCRGEARLRRLLRDLHRDGREHGAGKTGPRRCPLPSGEPPIRCDHGGYLGPPLVATAESVHQTLGVSQTRSINKGRQNVERQYHFLDPAPRVPEQAVVTRERQALLTASGETPLQYRLERRKHTWHFADSPFLGSNSSI